MNYTYSKKKTDNLEQILSYKPLPIFPVLYEEFTIKGIDYLCFPVGIDGDYVSKLILNHPFNNEYIHLTQNWIKQNEVIKGSDVVINKDNTKQIKKWKFTVIGISIANGIKDIGLIAIFVKLIEIGIIRI